MISDHRQDAASAALRAWLTTHLGDATPDALATHYQLSVVRVRDLIADEQCRRLRLSAPVVAPVLPDAVVPEPGPTTVGGERAFLTHVRTAQLEADIVRSLVVRFRLPEGYVKTRLAELGISLSPTRRPAPRLSTATR